jgi:predicted carbohydrate-binding protein with CBM5 and CBM33 domain
VRRSMIRLCAVAATSAVLIAGGVVAAFGHGYTTSPMSRAKYCQDKVVANCGDIQWEPQSVEGLKGFPSAGPADGTICAGGHARFSQLDDPRNGSWPTIRLTPGASYTFRWTLTAAHATTKFEYWVTRNGWTGRERLTRAWLEPAPFLTVPFGGQRPPFQVSHSGRLPNKNGRHLILAVWTIHDTGNAFYQCSDVVFGGGTPSGSAPAATDHAAHAEHTAHVVSEPAVQHSSEHCATGGMLGHPLL